MEWTEARALLALNTVPDLGPASIRKLVEEAGSAVAVVRLRNRRPDLVERAQAQEAALDRVGGELLAWSDAAYPPALQHLDHPPPVLLFRGSLAPLAEDRHRVAVVGSRACTPYGLAQARRFGAGLAAGGCAVVSGAARGIDQAAMASALEAGGEVVAVLGSGIDRPYPKEAEPLLERIVAAGGIVLSEFPCGALPHRGHFPRRNRVMAALSAGVLVVQATEKSGSMVTVSWALDLGREIYAVPGPVDCVASRGPHRLLREGAQLVESPQEIQATAGCTPVEDPATERNPILAALADGDRSLEELARQLERPAELLQLDLVELELRGQVTRFLGGLYHRCGPRPA